MTPASSYSGTKLAWLPRHLMLLRRRILCPPCYLQIQPTGVCNLRCRWCAYSGIIPRTTRPAQNIDRLSLLGTLRQFAELGGRALEVTGGGEPLCYPDIALVLRAALDLSLDVGLATNGLVEKEDRLRSIVDLAPGLAWLRVSLDASTPEEFRERKGRDGFDDVLRFLHEVISRCRGDSPCRVSISYLVDQDTPPEEVGRAVTIADDLGVTAVRFGPVHNGREIVDVGAATYERIKTYESRRNGARVVSVVDRRRRDAEEADRHPVRICGYMWTNCVLGADNRIYPCCSTTYSPAHMLCDLSQESFSEWWYSGARRHVLCSWRRRPRCQGINCAQRVKNDAFYDTVIDHPDDPYFI